MMFIVLKVGYNKKITKPNYLFVNIPLIPLLTLQMQYFPHPQPVSTTPPSSKQDVTRASDVWKGRPGHALGEVSRWGGGAVSLPAAVASVVPVGACILGLVSVINWVWG